MRYQKRKQLILQLIKNCEYYHLDEKRSMECINNILLNKPISRRTYYNYKSELYSDEIYEKLDKRSHYYKLKSDLLQLDKRFIIENEFEIKYLIYKQLTNEELRKKDEAKPESFSQSYMQVSQTKNRFDSSANKSNENFLSIPKNSTIREEFVKCGKDNCNECPDVGHGPYYYAYWKDPKAKKLRKKYLGVTDLTNF